MKFAMSATRESEPRAANRCSLWRYSILFCYAFTIACLVLALYIQSRALEERRKHKNDIATLMAKFKTRFHELGDSSQATSQTHLVDGFVNRMREIDEGVIEAEELYFRLMLIICVGLVFVNFIGVLTFLKGRWAFNANAQHERFQ